MSEGPNERHIDLLTILTHEIGHALGWNAEPTDPNFNPRYVALMDPQLQNLQSGTRVFLRSGSYNAPLAGDSITGESPANDLSHLASRGDLPGWKESLMSRVFSIEDRYLPGDYDLNMFKYAYGDLVNTSQPTTTTLGAAPTTSALWSGGWRTATVTATEPGGWHAHRHRLLRGGHDPPWGPPVPLDATGHASFTTGRR